MQQWYLGSLEHVSIEKHRVHQNVYGTLSQAQYYLATDLIDPIIPDTNRRQLHNQFIDTANAYSFTQTVVSPTRTQTRTRPDSAGGPYTISNTLDLFLTNNILNITNTQVVPGLSDHDIVLVDADLRPTRQKQRRRPIFLYSRADTDAITHDLTNYSADFFATDPHERPFLANWDSLKHAIHTTVENNIPQKIPSSRHSLPWFSRDLRRQHHKKQRLHTTRQKIGQFSITFRRFLPKI